MIPGITRQLMARTKAAGKAIGKADGYIAATAAARGFAVVTRDVSPFEATGLTVTTCGSRRALLVRLTP